MEKVLVVLKIIHCEKNIKSVFSTSQKRMYLLTKAYERNQTYFYYWNKAEVWMIVKRSDAG